MTASRKFDTTEPRCVHVEIKAAILRNWFTMYLSNYFIYLQNVYNELAMFYIFNTEQNLQEHFASRLVNFSVAIL